MDLADPPIGNHRTILIDPAAELLDLQLQLDQTPNDELELAT
jgi:hypothetical protein